MLLQNIFLDSHSWINSFKIWQNGLLVLTEIDGYLVEIYLGFGINLRSRLMSKEKLHVIQNEDKNVIIKSTKCEKIFISWIHKVFKQIVSPFNSGCHLYSDRDQQTGNWCRYRNIHKRFIFPFIGNSALKFMLKKVEGTIGQ